MRRDGELVPCTWEDALDDIAARIGALVAEHGPEVVADYTGTGGPLDPSGYALAEGFMRNLGSHQRYSALSIDCPAKFLVPQLMAGIQLQFQPDLDRAELLLAIGVNTVVSHGHGVMVPNPLGHLRDVRARGGRVVVVDPRRSESARHADLHVAPRPGTDAFIVAHLVREALARGGDAEFLARLRRRGQRRPARPRRRTVRRSRPRRRSPACRSPTCGPSTRSWPAAGRVAIETGTGVSMNRHANLTEWLVWALAAVTGSLDRPGGVTFNPGSLRRFEDAVPGGRGDLGPRPAEPARTCRDSSTARCPARSWPTRSGPGTCGRSSCASATRRSPSPVSPRCARRWRRWTCSWRSTYGRRRRPPWPRTCCR